MGARVNAILMNYLASVSRRRWCLGVPLWAMLRTAAAARPWKFVDEEGVVHLGNDTPPVDRGALTWLGPQAADPLPERLPALARMPGYAAVRPALWRAARDHGLDPALLVAIAAVESGFDPRAISPKGALGLLQVMPDTARRFGWAHVPAVQLRAVLLQAEPNAQTGARILSELLNRWQGRLELALAAYNAGDGAVQRYGGVIPPFRETETYVPKVLRLYLHWRDQI